MRRKNQRPCPRDPETIPLAGPIYRVAPETGLANNTETNGTQNFLCPLFHLHQTNIVRPGKRIGDSTIRALSVKEVDDAADYPKADS
jgi:hypothetical protein